MVQNMIIYTKDRFAQLVEAMRIPKYLKAMTARQKARLKARIRNDILCGTVWAATAVLVVASVQGWFAVTLICALYICFFLFANLTDPTLYEDKK